MKKIISILLACTLFLTVNAQNTNAPTFRKDVKGKDVYFPLQEKGKTYRISGKELAAQMGGGGGNTGDACECVDSFTQGYKVEENVNIKVVDSFKVTIDNSDMLTINPSDVSIKGTLNAANINVNENIELNDGYYFNTIESSGIFLTKDDEVFDELGITNSYINIQRIDNGNENLTEIDAYRINTGKIDAQSYSVNEYNTAELPVTRWAVQYDYITNKVYIVVNIHGILHRLEIPGAIVE